MNRLFRILTALIIMLSFASCSTTRVLQDGQYRLRKNKIEVTNDKSFNTNILTPYLKQKSIGWTPFMNVFNWTNGKGKTWDKIISRIGVAPAIYDASLVDASIENFIEHLEYLGYYDSKVESEISLHKRKVDVIYKVTLGKRFPISEIQLDLPKRGEFTQTFLEDTASMMIRKGDFLSESLLSAESDRSAAHMRNQGFFTFSKNNYFFEADTLTRPGSAILKMSINEYTRNASPSSAVPIRRFYIDDVTISYPKTLKIKNKILTDLNTIHPGRVYSADVVNETYSRLTAIRVFNSVNIGMTQKDTNLVDCSISLAQSKLQGFKVNFETSVNSTGLLGLSPQLSYYHKNIFHGGEWLNLNFMGNFQFKFNDDVRSNEFGVSAGLSFPKFFPLPYRYFTGAIPRTDVTVSYNFQNRPEYTRNIISTSYGYNGNYKNRLFYQVYPVQMNIVRLFNLDEEFYQNLANDPFLRNAYQDHFDLGSGGTLYYTTNTASIPKETYFYSRFQFDISGNLLSAFKPLMRKDAEGAGMVWNTPFSQFVRGEVTLGKTWIMGRKGGQSIATRLVAGAGYAYGNSNALPFEKHFYAGGASSLRGWQARTVGPGMAQRDSSFVIPNQTGDMRLEANVEYRFDMFWKLAGAVFIDAGNVWTLKAKNAVPDEESLFRWNTFAESIAANWGVGIRLNLGFLLMRVDMGMKIHDPAREQKWVNPGTWLQEDNYALHLGVGYPF